MPKTFLCEYCNYKTSKKSSFNDHLKSKKHIKNMILVPENEPICDDPLIVDQFCGPLDQFCGPLDQFCGPLDQFCGPSSESNDSKCGFCGKELCSKKYLNRHLKICKDKKVYDVQASKLKLEKALLAKQKQEELMKKEMEQQKEKLEELEEVQSDYYDLLRQIAKSKTSPQIINLHYVVNNFTEALNYEDLMTPKLTDAEVDEVRELEPIAGTINLIEKRCITGMDVKKRPLHCLDTSRNKYLVRTDNEWVVDHCAKRIFKGAAKHIHDMYATNPAKSNLSIEQIMRNQQKLLKLESKSSKNKMIKDLNDKVYIKNIKIDSITKN